MLPILFIYIMLHFEFLTITFRTYNNIDSKYSKTKALFTLYEKFQISNTGLESLKKSSEKYKKS